MIFLLRILLTFTRPYLNLYPHKVLNLSLYINTGPVTSFLVIRPHSYGLIYYMIDEMFLSVAKEK